MIAMSTSIMLYGYDEQGMPATLDSQKLCVLIFNHLVFLHSLEEPLTALQKV